MNVYYPSRFFWVFLNTEQPPFDNLSIRKAFALALDREHITSSLLVGDVPLTKPFPSLLSHSETSLNDANFIEAKRLFEQGMQECGYTRETFPPITLSHFLYVSGFTELAEYMQKVWSETFSIQIKLKGSEWNDFFKDLQEANYQIGGCSFDAHMHDPIEFLTRFEQKDSFNFPRWSSPRYKAILAELRITSDQTARTKLLKEAEEIILDEMPIIPVCTHSNFYVHPAKWTGIRIDPAGCIDFSKIRLK